MMTTASTDESSSTTCASFPMWSCVFILYETASTLKITFGSICENLSSTPETPKSGEVELQTAPKAAVAAIAMIASGQFGM